MAFLSIVVAIYLFVIFRFPNFIESKVVFFKKKKVSSHYEQKKKRRNEQKSRENLILLYP